MAISHLGHCRAVKSNRCNNLLLILITPETPLHRPKNLSTHHRLRSKNVKSTCIKSLTQLQASVPNSAATGFHKLLARGVGSHIFRIGIDLKVSDVGIHASGNNSVSLLSIY